MRSKKGSNQVYFLIISLIIASIVGAKMIMFSSDQSSSSNYLIEFYAKDIGLLMETLQAVPGDVEIMYPLEEGFAIKLYNQYLEIKHLPSGTEKKVYYHVFPQTTIEDAIGENLLRFVKVGNLITISNKRDNALCPVLNNYLGDKELSVSVYTKSESVQGTLSVEDLELIKSTFLHNLNNNNIKTGGASTLTITLTSTPATNGKNEIIITRPEASGDNARFFTYFFCSFKQHLASTDTLAYYPLKEEISGVAESGDSPELTIDFHITADKKQTLLRNRGDYGSSLVQVLNPLIKTTEANS